MLAPPVAAGVDFSEILSSFVNIDSEFSVKQEDSFSLEDLSQRIARVEEVFMRGLERLQGIPPEVTPKPALPLVDLTTPLKTPFFPETGVAFSRVVVPPLVPLWLCDSGIESQSDLENMVEPRPPDSGGIPVSVSKKNSPPSGRGLQLSDHIQSKEDSSVRDGVLTIPTDDIPSRLAGNLGSTEYRADGRKSRALRYDGTFTGVAWTRRSCGSHHSAN